MLAGDADLRGDAGFALQRQQDGRQFHGLGPSPEYRQQLHGCAPALSREGAEIKVETESKVPERNK